MSNSVTPEDLWYMLVSLIPGISSTTRPDLDMLREAYQRNQQCAESQAVRESFESALENWTDDQMREFLLRWLSEPGQLIGVEAASLDRLRHFLEQVSEHIFG